MSTVIAWCERGLGGVRIKIKLASKGVPFVGTGPDIEKCCETARATMRDYRERELDPFKKAGNADLLLFQIERAIDRAEVAGVSSLGDRQAMGVAP